MCIYMHEGTHVWRVHVHVCIHACGRLRLTFFRLSSSITRHFMGVNLFFNWKLTNSSQVNMEWGSHLCLLNAGITRRLPSQCSFDMRSGPHTCVASTLSFKPFPKSCKHAFITLILQLKNSNGPLFGHADY